MAKFIIAPTDSRIPESLIDPYRKHWVQIYNDAVRLRYPNPDEYANAAVMKRESFVMNEADEGISLGPIREKQLPIGEESKKALLQARMNIFFDESDALAERMFTGDISLGQWQEQMKSLIRNAHSSAAAIGKGGWDLMTAQDWGRLGTPMREQYRYLQGFAEVIAANKDTISLRAIQARARLYGEGAGASTVRMQADVDIIGQLPWYPKDGSTECLNRCHCRWDMKVVSTMPDKRKVVEAVWRLGDAEHCETCVSRNGHKVTIIVQQDTYVPGSIGGI